MVQKKTPKKVKIGPFNFEIKCDKESIESAKVQFESLDALGFMSTIDQSIYIDPELQDDMKAETLLHEMLHAVCMATGITNTFESKDEEKFIATISPMLLDTLRSNNDVTDFLLNRNS